MTKKEFYLQLDELLELPPGTIKGDEQLADVARWDSLSVMGFVALLDREFGLRASGESINACRTVPELVALTGGKVTD